MALKFRGEIKPGQNVLINGATGVTGRLAVQISKYYGAKNIITTGRNLDILEKTKILGASKTVCLKQDEDTFIKELREIHNETPIDLVIDYLWGRPIEWILKTLYVENSSGNKVRIVSVGSMAGENINLASSTLRSSVIEILGSGLGSLSQEDLNNFDKEILPEMFQLAADGKLKMELIVDSIKNIESLWRQKIDGSKRLVIANK